MLEHYWTVTDIARLRKCHRSTVHRAAARLEIRGQRSGLTRFFNRHEFRRIAAAIHNSPGRPKKGRAK